VNIKVGFSKTGKNSISCNLVNFLNLLCDAVIRDLVNEHRPENGNRRCSTFLRHRVYTRRTAVSLLAWLYRVDQQNASDFRSPVGATWSVYNATGVFRTKMFGILISFLLWRSFDRTVVSWFFCLEHSHSSHVVPNFLCLMTLNYSLVFFVDAAYSYMQVYIFRFRRFVVAYASRRFISKLGGALPSPTFFFPHFPFFPFIPLPFSLPPFPPHSPFPPPFPFRPPFRSLPLAFV